MEKSSFKINEIVLMEGLLSRVSVKEECFD